MTRPTFLDAHCRFCAIARGLAFYGAADFPIDSTAEYLAIASIGALVEGWSLILPKNHCLSLRDFYGVGSLSEFLQRVVVRVEALYGPTVIFEHGANHRGSLTSCGTDHGHLHIVPLNFSVRDAVAESKLLSWERIRASQIRAKVEDSEYLFFSQAPHTLDPFGYVNKLTHPVSQFFRRLIAAKLGKTHVADYRQHPLLSTAQRTRERLLAIE
ncbi:MAG: hypothetical protein WAP47_02500 [Candidatus Rokuibacteriota bacterium]